MKQKPRIDAVIVVEGRDDTIRLRTFFDVDTIETNGSALTDETIETIRQLQKERRVIVLTDPDYAGEKIRTKLSQALPDIEHAFVLREDAHDHRGKIGVEAASAAVLQHALGHVQTAQAAVETFSWQSMIDFGLVGDKQRRRFVAERLSLGEVNAKQCFKRLNMFGVSEDAVADVLKEWNE